MNIQNRPPLLTPVWIDATRLDIARSTGAPAIDAAGTGLANKAILVPCVFPCRVTILGINVAFVVATGNYDLGIYDANFNLLGSKGTTAGVAIALNTFTLATPLRLEAGRLLYGALVCSLTTDTFARTTPNSPSYLGVVEQALGDTTLANPATPATPTSTTVPIMSWNLRS